MSDGIIDIYRDHGLFKYDFYFGEKTKVSNI